MEKRNKLARFAGAFAGTTFISRILGFWRDMIVASIFGAGLHYDAFLVAFKIPNFLRRLFAEGAFAQAFVPLLSEYQTHKDPHEIKMLIDKVAGSLAFVLFWITLIGVLAAPLLIYLFAPGFQADATRWDLAVDMLRITFPYLLFISLTALASSVLNTYGKFAVPGFTPVWLNVIMIIGAIYAAPYFEQPIMALAWSVLIAGVVQLLFQLPFLWKLGVFPRFRWGFNDPGVKRLLWLMLPIIFGASVAQINLILGTLFASFLPVGSLSWLYFAERLMEFPLGIFGVALATAILPQLSKEHAAQKPQQFSATLDWALRSVCIIGLPAAVGLGVLAGPLIATLFHYGAFGEKDVYAVIPTLEALALGVLAFMLVKILAGAFYAQQDVRTPVRIAAYTIVVNMALNLLLMPVLAHVGLALATALSAFFNGVLLFGMLRYRKYYLPLAGWGKFTLQLSLAIALMLGFLLVAMGDIEDWLLRVWWERLLYLLGLVGGAVIIYFATLWLSGLRFRQILSPKQIIEG
jgi:putative peptidoglycan lipid II flippase